MGALPAPGDSRSGLPAPRSLHSIYCATLPPLEPAPAPLATALADHYRLRHVLGRGGMATVYLADDLRHHREVAVKVLRPDLALSLGAARFLTEELVRERGGSRAGASVRGRAVPRD
jgi:serine/threonine protein kinase